MLHEMTDYALAAVQVPILNRVALVALPLNSTASYQFGRLLQELAVLENGIAAYRALGADSPVPEQPVRIVTVPDRVPDFLLVHQISNIVLALKWIKKEREEIAQFFSVPQPALHAFLVDQLSVSSEETEDLNDEKALAIVARFAPELIKLFVQYNAVTSDVKVDPTRLDVFDANRWSNYQLLPDHGLTTQPPTETEVLPYSQPVARSSFFTPLTVAGIAGAAIGVPAFLRWRKGAS